MPRPVALLVLAVLGMAALGAAPGRAALVDVIAALTPNALGTGNPFGIASLPAGPFTATLSFAGPLAPNATIATLPGLTAARLTGFSLRIGTASCDASDLTYVFLQTDAAGIATSLALFGGALGSEPAFVFNQPSFATDVSWYALEGDFCGLSVLPLEINGVCIAGSPGTVSLSPLTRDPTEVTARRPV